MEEKIFNLFADDDNEFELFGYKFIKVQDYEIVKDKGYKPSTTTETIDFDTEGNIIEEKRESPEQIGEHVHTFTAIFDFEQEPSVFYRDGKKLNDIVLLLRFFLGTYVCTEQELTIAWNKYHAERLENQRQLTRHVLPKIKHILKNFDRKRITDLKLHVLLFLYVEMFKVAYLDIQIALISPILNVLIDLFSKETKENQEQLKFLLMLREKVSNDSDYTESEKEMMTVALTKLMNGFKNDFTTKTVNFIKSIDIISQLPEINDKDKRILEFAQLINTLRNGVVHAGNLRPDNVEKKFNKVKMEHDDDTFRGKIRVFKIGVIFVQNAILNLLGINDYFYKKQELKSVEDFFVKGTFREF